MNVLAVGAHPLDIVFLCGGTLARFARAGHTVAIVHLALPMSKSLGLSLEELAAIREDDPVMPWMEWMEVTARYRGIQAGVRCAQAFRPLHKWGSLSSEHRLP